MSRLFGTDGIRGKVNDSALTAQTAFRLGSALVAFYGPTRKNAPFLIARDTRISADMLACALAAGILSSGGDAIDVGVIPTPALSVLNARFNAAAGIMISASHNPYYDNGLKVFDEDGSKLSDANEDEIQALMEGGEHRGERIGVLHHSFESTAMYSQHVMDAFPGLDLSGLTVVLDTANGAAYRSAPGLFRHFGANVICLFDAPNGMNINDGCGSTSPAAMAQAVVDNKANVGFALDGDGDRLISADETGKIRDGDFSLYAMARELKSMGRLPNNALAATILSNMGLEAALSRAGIALHRTQVGDRYVIQKIREEHLSLGGEQSGHTIIPDFIPSGDGTVSALFLASILAKSGGTYSELAGDFVPFPQHALNVHVSEAAKHTYGENPRIAEAIQQMQKKYEGSGRVQIRASGTENVIRINVEGPDGAQIAEDAETLAKVMREELDS